MVGLYLRLLKMTISNNPLNLSEKELVKFNAKRDKIYSELHAAMNTPDKPKTVKRSDKPISYFTKEQKNDYYKLQKKVFKHDEASN